MSRENRTGGKGKPRPWVRPGFDTGTRVHKDGKLRRDQKRSHDWRDWMADTERFDDLEDEDFAEGALPEEGLSGGEALEADDSPPSEPGEAGAAPGSGDGAPAALGGRKPRKNRAAGPGSPPKKMDGGGRPAGAGRPPAAGRSTGAARPRGAGRRTGTDGAGGGARSPGASKSAGKGGRR
jgi:hypothetical protein